MNNPYRVIKLLSFVTGLCMATCTTTLAQQSLFVYLQSENGQPFYVQMDNKVYSSSAIGHLILSDLPDKTCNFEIGFPQKAIQPQRFSIPLGNKDHGYQLVNKGSGNWALRDLQTDETINPLKDAGASLLYGERKNDDAFATLMAAVVNDSAVLYTSVVRKEVEAVPTVAKSEVQPAIESRGNAEEKAVQPKDSTVTEKKVEAVTVTGTPTTGDPASQVKNETAPAPDSGVVSQKGTDTLVTKYDPKERGLNDKPVVGGVAKIQQQTTKDGETKMVFVDSSETPAKVVTVYINEEKPADNNLVAQTPASGTPAVAKDEPKQEPVVKDSAKTEPAKTKEEIAEQIKKETWGSAAEKKPAATDTLTIVLESPQMKKSSKAEEKPQPLYRPKEEEKQPEPVKSATSNNTMAQLTDPGKMEVEVVTGNAVVREVPVKPEAADTVLKKEPAKESPKAVMESKPAETEKPKVEPEKKEESSKLVMINSDCVKLATDNDVDKMRVKMMGESDLQKRLGVANKYFKTMCLYARQIKALSELFPGDDGKYKFLEMAYPFAADTANFKQLYELFSDEAYVTKFKKLVRLQ
jgi:hypothetical protein